MELDVRLQILKDAGQISEETFEALKQVINMFKDNWELVLTEENGAMFITHLCVAMERIKQDKAIDGIDSEVYEEIKNDENFSKSKLIFQDIIKTANIEIPENEETFIMMHLCTLLQENK
ncbi:PRD domain-containing protein [Clostridium swellfunianum]|uniref:PRD domain-containing protein n=1 Tax=Clostridium swellfunianum TaxID=1367462 RepID=UPI00202ED4E0|nr:PRD domain-containing protein [Clostridium swellfunianum]MCM0649734.1 PRD domain-containing protein [Clostridium swellfunianum]